MNRLSGLFAALALGTMAASCSGKKPDDFNPVRDVLVSAGLLEGLKQDSELQNFCGKLGEYKAENEDKFKEQFDHGTLLVPVFLCNAVGQKDFADIAALSKDFGTDQAKALIKISVDSTIQETCSAPHDDQDPGYLKKLCQAMRQPG